MNNLVLFLYIFIVAAGCAGTAALIFLQLKFKSKLTARLLLVNCLLFCSLFINILTFYIETMTEYPDFGRGIRYILAFILSLGTYAGLTSALISIKGAPKRSLTAAGAFIIAVMTARLLLAMRAPDSVQEKLRLPLILIISLFLLFAGIVMMRYSGNVSARAVSNIIARMGVFTVFFAVFSAIYYFLTAVNQAFGRVHISLDYIYFLIWSIISVTGFINHMRRPEIDEAGNISEDFIAQYGITEREAEIISAIGRGLSNQEIADELFISFTTVRTHVYNIFRKTGAKSRMELIGKLNK